MLRLVRRPVESSRSWLPDRPAGWQSKATPGIAAGASSSTATASGTPFWAESALQLRTTPTSPARSRRTAPQRPPVPVIAERLRVCSVRRHPIRAVDLNREVTTPRHGGRGCEQLADLRAQSSERLLSHPKVTAKFNRLLTCDDTDLTVALGASVGWQGPSFIVRGIDKIPLLRGRHPPGPSSTMVDDRLGKCTSAAFRGRPSSRVGRLEWLNASASSTSPRCWASPHSSRPASLPDHADGLVADAIRWFLHGP